MLRPPRPLWQFTRASWRSNGSCLTACDGIVRIVVTSTFHYKTCLMDMLLFQLNHHPTQRNERPCIYLKYSLPGHPQGQHNKLRQKFRGGSRKMRPPSGGRLQNRRDMPAQCYGSHNALEQSPHHDLDPDQSCH
jgi:hypothetical protein